MLPIENRTFEDHRDSWGLLTQRDWRDKHDFDGGDTAHREGMWVSLVGMLDPERVFIRQYFKTVIQCHLQHPTKKGIWRRHPDIDNYFYGEWDRMSRDQIWEIVIAMAVIGMEKELDVFFWHLFKRGGFMTNTRRNGSDADNHGMRYYSSAKDLSWWEALVLKHRIPVFNVKKGWRNNNWKVPDFAGPEFWSIYFKYKIKKRGWKWMWSKVFVWIGELESLAGTMNKVHRYGKDPKNDDDSNHIMPHLYGKWSGTETFIGRFSRRYYFKNRPFAGEPNLNEYEVSNGPMLALRKYFDGNKWNTSADPPLDRLAAPLVNAMGD